MEKVRLAGVLRCGAAPIRHTQNSPNIRRQPPSPVTFISTLAQAGRDLDELIDSWLEVCYGKGVAFSGALLGSFLCDRGNRCSRDFPIRLTTRGYQENRLTIRRADLEVVNGRQRTLRRGKGVPPRRRFATAQPGKKPAPLGCSPQLFR